MASDSRVDQWYDQMENPQEFYSAAEKYWEVSSGWQMDF